MAKRFWTFVIKLADLIAAAPEMYEALENARETIAYLRQYVAGQGLSAEGNCDDALDAIDAVLNKAQGSDRAQDGVRE